MSIPLSDHGSGEVTDCDGNDTGNAKNKSSGQTASYEDHESHEKGESEDDAHKFTTPA